MKSALWLWVADRPFFMFFFVVEIDIVYSGQGAVLVIQKKRNPCENHE